MSIFGLLAKLLETMLKRRRKVLFFAHGEDAGVAIVVCYDRRV